MITKKTSLTLAIGTAFAAAAGLAPVAHAAGNPFGLQKLDSGYQLAAADMKKEAGMKKMTDMKKEVDKKTDGKCGEGKCGGDKPVSEKMKDGQCGAADNKVKMKDGSCGGDKK